MKVIAVLHDVMEDNTKYTRNVLDILGVDSDTLDVLDLLTHKEGDTYKEYILKLRVNQRARRIKLADMICNLSDSPTYRQKNKYVKFAKLLLD